MTKQPTKRGRGRPPVDIPQTNQLNVRIDDTLKEALEMYRQKHELDALSDATRHALRRQLRADGLLEPKK